ncbi:HpcH/HpaI aldolase family protein [Fredinandcohnia onubensis]|uniref:HpcH/HpaI aldolase family protein n=1 Tax=Fredinandcohnia onubensis TaxID=1571209 RepID=UPI000C0BC9E0|nr:aldolase/citrate lyase family protein [Fredinandcohnia onubensis]
MNNNVKSLLRSGDRALGMFLNMYSPALLEMIAYAEFDFVIIDNEHGSFSDSELENLIRAAECADIVPIVRLSYDPSSIQKALDRGARGIQVPMVNTKEQAEEIVKKAKYPPLGNRGTTYSIRPAKYGRLSGEEFLDNENDSVLIIVQIETPEAVENFEEIVSVPGIDVAFIGPLDLAINSGYRKEGIHHPEIKNTIKQLHELGVKKDIAVGTIAPTSKDIEEAFENGTQYVVAVANSLINQSFNSYKKSWDEQKINRLTSIQSKL